MRSCSRWTLSDRSFLPDGGSGPDALYRVSSDRPNPEGMRHPNLLTQLRSSTRLHPPKFVLGFIVRATRPTRPGSCKAPLSNEICLLRLVVFVSNRGHRR